MKLYLTCLLTICICFYTSAQSTSNWSSWATVYEEPGAGRVDISFRLTRCDGKNVVGWPRYRTQNTFKRDKAYVSFRFEYRNCEGKLSSEGVTVNLAKPEIDDDGGRWFLGVQILRIYDIKYKDYNSRPTGGSQGSGANFTNTTGSGSSNTQTGGGSNSAPRTQPPVNRQPFDQYNRQADQFESSGNYNEALRSLQNARTAAPSDIDRQLVDQDIKRLQNLIDQQNFRKQLKTDDINQKISQIENPQDRQRLRNQLSQLQGNPQADVASYDALLSSAESTQRTETQLKQQYSKFDQTYSGMSSDHRSRQEPARRKQELEAIQNNNNLTAAEKLQQTEEVNKKLEFNKSVLKDDERRLTAVNNEIDNAKRLNQAEGAATAGALVVVGAGLLAIDGVGNEYERPSVSLVGRIGVGYMNLPVQTQSVTVRESNNGTGGQVAQKVRTVNQPEAMGTDGLGFTAYLRASPYISETVTFSLFGSYGVYPFDGQSIVSALGSSSATSGSTTGAFKMETTASTMLQSYSFGFQAAVGLKPVKLLVEAYQQKVWGRYSYTSTSTLDLGRNGYLNTWQYNDATDISAVSTRLMGGLRIGSYAKGAVFDVLAGTDKITQSGQNNSPLLFGLDVWIHNIASVKTVVGPNYFNGKKWLVEVSLAKSFDFFWGYKKK